MEVRDRRSAAPRRIATNGIGAIVRICPANPLSPRANVALSTIPCAIRGMPITGFSATPVCRNACGDNETSRGSCPSAWISALGKFGSASSEGCGSAKAWRTRVLRIIHCPLGKSWPHLLFSRCFLRRSSPNLREDDYYCHFVEDRCNISCDRHPGLMNARHRRFRSPATDRSGNIGPFWQSVLGGDGHWIFCQGQPNRRRLAIRSATYIVRLSVGTLDQPWRNSGRF